MGERRNPSVYLGDGVRATFDGWHIVLTVDRDGREETVFLDPTVFYELVVFARRYGFTVPDAPDMPPN